MAPVDASWGPKSGAGIVQIATFSPSYSPCLTAGSLAAQAGGGLAVQVRVCRVRRQSVAQISHLDTLVSISLDGHKGITSVAPMRGCSPECDSMSMRLACSLREQGRCITLSGGALMYHRAVVARVRLDIRRVQPSSEYALLSPRLSSHLDLH